MSNSGVLNNPIFYSIGLLDKLGSDCTGVDGAINRTLDISPVIESTLINVNINGLLLIKTSQYTISGSTITFLPNVDNTDNIDITYLQ